MATGLALEASRWWTMNGGRGVGCALLTMAVYLVRHNRSTNESPIPIETEEWL
jgi:hypothetical protein